MRAFALASILPAVPFLLLCLSTAPAAAASRAPTQLVEAGPAPAGVSVYAVLDGNGAMRLIQDAVEGAAGAPPAGDLLEAGVLFASVKPRLAARRPARRPTAMEPALERAFADAHRRVRSTLSGGWTPRRASALQRGRVLAATHAR